MWRNLKVLKLQKVETPFSVLPTWPILTFSRFFSAVISMKLFVSQPLYSKCLFSLLVLFASCLLGQSVAEAAQVEKAEEAEAEEGKTLCSTMTPGKRILWLYLVITQLLCLYSSWPFPWLWTLTKAQSMQLPALLLCHHSIRQRHSDSMFLVMCADRSVWGSPSGGCWEDSNCRR